MPEISSLIATTSGSLKAGKALRGIKAGQFTINVTLLGVILSLGTAGFSPQRSSLVDFAGFVRFVSLCYLASWYKIIVK